MLCNINDSVANGLQFFKITTAACQAIWQIIIENVIIEYMISIEHDSETNCLKIRIKKNRDENIFALHNLFLLPPRQNLPF